jgi:phage-related protein
LWEPTHTRALKAFPDEARREAGFNLDFVQRGFDPENWKPRKTVGAGVSEIRIRELETVPKPPGK